MRNEPTADDAVARLLDAAELWLAAPPADRRTAVTTGHPTMVAGWEDAHPFCAVVCTTDLGLAFCRRCPETLVRDVADRRRTRSTRCPAGVRLLAFPVPVPVQVPVNAPSAPADRRVAVLRVAPPTRSAAAAAAPSARVAPARLRRAAAATRPADGPAVRRAVATLRDPVSLTRWQAGQRETAADRRRSSAAALAQMAATAEELADLYRTARRERAELDRSRRRVDRLAQEAVRARDHEGALIAHRIHDTAAQSMVSAFRFLDAARATAAVEGARPEVDRQLGEASERLLTAIREVRGVLAQVLPPGLAELGLGSAIRSRLRFLLAERDGAAPIAGEVTGELPRLVDWVEQALYSIVSEAVANAVRHSGATRIDVELRVMRGRAVVTIDDDGRGIEPRRGRTDDGHGLGLLGMSRQTSWLGGRIAIGPRTGGGTRIRISIPLARHGRRLGASGPAAALASTDEASR